MGSGITKKEVNKIECPDNYDTIRFDKILKLFKILDKNKNNILELDEMILISEKHINNRKKLLENRIESENRILELKINTLQSEKDKKIDNIKLDFYFKKNNLERENKNIENKINKKILILETLDDKEKCKRLMDKISYNKNKIDFWKFFTYMKERTDDIENID
jgi:hypothetical protein